MLQSGGHVPQETGQALVAGTPAAFLSAQALFFAGASLSVMPLILPGA